MDDKDQALKKALADDDWDTPGLVISRSDHANRKLKEAALMYKKVSMEYVDSRAKRASSNNSQKLQQFDQAMKTITQNRGQIYGHPKEDFRRAVALKAVVAECEDPLVRHVLEMMCVKLARLIETPNHLDGFIDIAGYARTGVMLMEEDGGG